MLRWSRLYFGRRSRNLSRFIARKYPSTTPEVDAILLRLDEGPLWLALHEHQTVGTASVVPKGTGFYVRGMAALPEARGLGVRRRLLEQVELYAVEKCCERLFLSTTPFLSRAIRLYEGFGFRASDRPPHDLFGTPLFTMEKVLSRNPLAI